MNLFTVLVRVEAAEFSGVAVTIEIIKVKQLFSN